MPFRDILGQAEPIAFLRQALAQDRIPSAYLFRGAHHVGKRSTALALAQALNCAVPEGGDACGRCPSCRKIAEGVHPDVETVAPDGQYIRIDQVRGIAERLALIPYEARKRVVVLAQADRMNPPAANAFLKTLEEPPHDTLLVLCVQDPGRLPETIASRCVPVRFALLSDETLQRLLGADGSLDGDTLAFAVRFAQGRLRPRLKEQAADWMRQRNELIQLLDDLHRPAFPHLSERLAQWSASEGWRFALEWLETWFRDLALLASGAGPEHLVNADCQEQLREAAERFTSGRAERCYRAVLDTRDALTAWNANKALALEALWLDIKAIA